MKHGLSNSCRRRGFTLIEVLVTMALMAIVLPVVMRGIDVALSAASTARHTAEAAQLAQSKLNEIIASGDPTSFGSSGDFGNEWPAYRWAATTSVDDNNMTSVNLIVTWQQSGRPRTFSLTTMVYLS